MTTRTTHAPRTQRSLQPALLAVGLAILALALPARADRDDDRKDREGHHKHHPHIVPPHAKFRGLTYGEWGARWWSKAFSIPVVGGSHPVISGGAFPGDKGVLFLAGIGGGAVFNITIPAGTPIFFPVINTECSVLEPDPFHGDDEASLRACANGHIDHTSGRFAVIDGVPVRNLDRYRVESPLFEFGPLPENNLFEFFGLDAPAGTTSDSVDAGVYVLVTPLRVGQHTIRFGGTFDELGFSIDTRFNITVAPRKRGHHNDHDDDD